MSIATDILFDDIDYTWAEKFWCTPVAFRAFVEEEEYLNSEALSEPQYEAIEELIGIDPLKIFDINNREYNELIAVIGKGGGKDFVISRLFAYITYLCSCMHSPQQFFSMPAGEDINLVNIALNATQAKERFFDKFCWLIKHSPWFVKYHDIVESGKTINRHKGSDAECRGTIQIGTNRVRFPNLVAANSEHSKNDSFEGKNVLIWVMDEASGFKNEQILDERGNTKSIGKAQDIYLSLRSSANSRFPKIWIGIVISFPRRDNDFTMEKYKESQEESNKVAVGVKKATWEWLPMGRLIKAGKYSGDTFKFEGLEIPVEFHEDFAKDPDDSLCKYAAQPTVGQRVFFKYPHKIDEAIVGERYEPLIETQTIYHAGEIMVKGVCKKVEYKGKLITGYNIRDAREYKRSRVVHIDFSIANDTTSMVIAHAEPCNIKSTMQLGDDSETEYIINRKIVVDDIFIWRPEKKKSIQVSVLNVDEFLIHLQNTLNIRAVSYDQFQSQFAIERLARAGVLTENHNINDTDYTKMRQTFYASAIEIPNHPQLITELKNIIFTGKRVDHTTTGSKDIADCLCGVVRLLGDIKFRKTIKESRMPSPVSGRNMNSRGQQKGFSPSPQQLQQDKILRRISGISTPRTPHQEGDPVRTVEATPRRIPKPVVGKL